MKKATKRTRVIAECEFCGEPEKSDEFLTRDGFLLCLDCDKERGHELSALRRDVEAGAA